MSEKRFELDVRVDMPKLLIDTATNKRYHLLLINDIEELVGLLNEQQNTIFKLEEEKGYWKSKAMTLLFQVRRLTPRMTDKEVIEFGKELEDE